MGITLNYEKSETFKQFEADIQEHFRRDGYSAHSYRGKQRRANLSKAISTSEKLTFSEQVALLEWLSYEVSIHKDYETREMDFNRVYSNLGSSLDNLALLRNNGVKAMLKADSIATYDSLIHNCLVYSTYVNAKLTSDEDDMLNIDATVRRGVIRLTPLGERVADELYRKYCLPRYEKQIKKLQRLQIL